MGSEKAKGKVKKEHFSADELDSWGRLAQARKERKRSKMIENEKVEEENKEKIIKKFLDYEGIKSEEALKKWMNRRD